MKDELDDYEIELVCRDVAARADDGRHIIEFGSGERFYIEVKNGELINHVRLMEEERIISLADLPTNHAEFSDYCKRNDIPLPINSDGSHFSDEQIQELIFRFIEESERRFRSKPTLH